MGQTSRKTGSGFEGRVHVLIDEENKYLLFNPKEKEWKGGGVTVFVKSGKATVEIDGSIGYERELTEGYELQIPYTEHPTFISTVPGSMVWCTVTPADNEHSNRRVRLLRFETMSSEEFLI